MHYLTSTLSDQKQWKVKGLNKPKDENGNIIESRKDSLLKFC